MREHETKMRMTSQLFTNSGFCSLHGNDKGIVFKTLHFGTRCHVNERLKLIKSFPFSAENSPCAFKTGHLAVKCDF